MINSFWIQWSAISERLRGCVPAAEDRRRIWFELTDAGRHKLADELATGQGWPDRAIAERLTPEERKALDEVFPILRKLGSEPPVG